MTRRTDPIFEVFDADDAFRTTPSEEEMQQIWDLIGPLMERYLRLRPIWQVAAGAFIEGFETGALKRLMWFGEGPFPKDSIEDHQDALPSKRPMLIGTTPVQDYPRLPRELLTEEEAADYLQIRVQTLRQWRSGGYRKKEKIPYLKVGRAVRYRKADLIAWTVSRVGETERAKEAAVKVREEKMREVRELYRRRGEMQPERETVPIEPEPPQQPESPRSVRARKRGK
jgi:excisionase family DNA binding protein